MFFGCDLVKVTERKALISTPKTTAGTSATLGPDNTLAPESTEALAPESTEALATTALPSALPTSVPTIYATNPPSALPTDSHTMAPTDVPTNAPTNAPTMAPTKAPTAKATAKPTVTPAPTKAPEKSIFEGSTASFKFSQAGVCTNTISKTTYADLFKYATNTDITVPALPQYFVPQGIDYWKEENVFIISGYFKPTDYYQYSVLFAVNATTGKYVGEWNLYNVNGTPHSGHDGGVAVTETDIYLSVNYTLFRISKDTVKKLGNSGNLKIDEEIKVATKASYCNYSNGILWVGEFSLNGDASYTITGHGFNENHAWTIGYKLTADYKMKSVPDYVISTPEKIQGFTMLDDGRIFMTSSYGRTNKSTVYVSKSAILSEKAAGTVTISGSSVNIYYTSNYTKITAIPMTEGCCKAGGSIYVMFESGAYNYRSGALDPTDKLWKFTF